METGITIEDPDYLFSSAVAGGNPNVLVYLFDQGYEMPGNEYHEDIYDSLTDVIGEEGNGRIEDGVRMFEMLLEKGLDMSEMSESGWHYGHQAVRNYSPSSVMTYIEEERTSQVNALRLRFVKRVVDEVLAAGIDIDQPYDGVTMLMNAAEGAHADVLRYLLYLGADATLKDDSGQTALDIAAGRGRGMIEFWDDDQNIKARYTRTVEMLGGNSEMLEPQASAGSDF
jgi:hypothetical protein